MNWHRWGTAWLAFRVGVLTPLLPAMTIVAHPNLALSDEMAVFQQDFRQEIAASIAQETRLDTSAQDLRRGDYQLSRDLVAEGSRKRIEQYFRFSGENTAELLVLNAGPLTKDTAQVETSRDVVTLMQPHSHDVKNVATALESMNGALAVSPANRVNQNTTTWQGEEFDTREDAHLRDVANPTAPEINTIGPDESPNVEPTISP
ncbi:MAG: hypothetical protein HYZ73_06350 [Elusimicrobia bacterium]|nr:hypothetical protein [Elusimicrobiota bacterium]